MVQGDQCDDAQDSRQHNEGTIAQGQGLTCVLNNDLFGSVGHRNAAVIVFVLNVPSSLA